MPDLDLAELDRLCKATPGLWQVHGVLGQVEIASMASTFAPFVPIAHCHYAAPAGPSGAPTFAEAVANAELIVHLVNNWDALRARIAELERKAAAWDAVKGNIHEAASGTGKFEGYECDAWWHEEHPTTKAISAAVAAKESKHD